MAQRKTLTTAQIDILRWISDGCLGAAATGNGRRVSAAALRNRGLVTTTGHGPTWTAVLTDKGAEYLAATDSDQPPVPRAAGGVTDQLIADIVDADGTLVVEQPRHGSRSGVDYRARAGAAVRHGKVPAGKRLRVLHVRGGLELSLVDAPEQATTAVSVTVPHQISLYHPAARQVRDRPLTFRVSQSTSQRAARIVHALASAAADAGFDVEVPDLVNRKHWSATPPVAVVARSGLQIPIQLTEEGVRRRADIRLPYTASDRSVHAEMEANATGRFNIELPQRYDGQPWRWGDRKSWQLEDKLTEVLAGLHARVADHQARQDELERQAAARQVEWEEAMITAKDRYRWGFLAAAMEDEAARWTSAQSIRGYATALRTAYPTEEATRAWATWAENHAAQIDPLSTPPQTPTPPEPTADELRPFLGRWSPYGADVR